jgi:hypothetical protein
VKVGKTALEAIRYCRVQPGAFMQKTAALNKSGNFETSYALQPIGIRVRPSDAAEILASGWMKPRDPGLFGDDPALAQTWIYNARPAAGSHTRNATKEAAMAKFSVKVVAFQAVRANTLFGFVDVVVPEIRMQFFDLPVHQNGTSRWADMPARPQLDRETYAAQRDDRDRIVYTPVLGFLDDKTRKAFSDRVVESLVEFNPHAFDETTAGVS